MTKFEEFLHNKYMEENPWVLDDDLPDKIDEWLTDMETETLIEYAEEWKKELNKEWMKLIEETEDTKKLLRDLRNNL